MGTFNSFFCRRLGTLVSLVNNCTEVGGLFHHDKDKTDLAQGGCFPAGILESYFHMLMEEKTPKSSFNSWFHSFCNKAGPNSAPTTCASRTENIHFKVTKNFVSSLTPSQLHRYPEARGSQFKVIIVVKYLGYQQGLR